MNADTQHHQHQCHHGKRRQRAKCFDNKQHQRRRRCGITLSPALLLWVTTLLSSWKTSPVSKAKGGILTGFSSPLSLVVQAQGETTIAGENRNKQEKDATSTNSGEIEQQFSDFWQTLMRDYSYVHLVVAATKEKKTSLNKGGPPVMIGRRRSLLEHSIHQHYSMHYLQLLHKQRNSNTDDNNNNSNSNKDQQQLQLRDKQAALHQAIKAYLYQTPYDAHIKANPQRQQHNAASSNVVGLPPFPPSLRKKNAQLLKDMFYRSYHAYMQHSFPAAELLPLTCQPGTFDLVRLPALTLIDALDTLLVLGDSLEFAKSVERLRAFHEAHLHTGGIFAVPQNVSVFETTIRVLGGLLSAHQMAVAYLKNKNSHDQHQDTRTTRDNTKLPPVFLKDVFDHSPEDEYLQPPPHVTRLLEAHQHKVSTSAGEGGDGTCILGNGAGSPLANEDEHEELQIPSPEGDVVVGADREDWRDHCGAGVLALEDCAASKWRSTKGKHQQELQQQAVNHTVARLKKEQQLRLLREPQWEYDGFLLELALDIGERLLPAFDTRTGIPFGTVNLLNGVPSGETTVASLAGGGTLSLEMELLSRLTGDIRFGRAAKLAMRALWVRRSSLNLVGKHIDIQRGTWTENLSGIGSNSDSFLEYLLKHYLLFPEEEDFWIMLQAAYTGIFKDARLGEWYADVDMKTGKQSWPKGMVKRVLESLMAFYPGMQTLMGELVPAARSLNSFFMVREFLGFLPERFSYSTWKVDGGISSGAAKYPLRPELLESCYFMHRATKQDKSALGASSSWEWAADFALHHLERLTRAKCGYASVRGLSPATGNVHNYETDQVKLSNEMPSFFLSETIKYLYLTFDDDNIIHNDQDREWIFTTEAHPIHFVPTFGQQEEAKQNEKNQSVFLQTIKDRLRKKLKVLKYHKAHRTFSSSRSKPTLENGVSAHYLAEEMWSEHTQSRKYRSSINEVVDEIYESEEQNRFDPDWHPVKSFFGDEVTIVDPMQREGKEHLFQEDNNLAHMAWSSVGMGSGYGMRKACANTYAPELTWLNALSGGALDYTDIYVSAMSESDGDFPPTASVHLLLNSAEALSVHGSGVYLGIMDHAVKASEQCSLAQQAEKSKTTGPASAESSERPPAPDEALPTGTVQQVELAGVGLFEISAFPEGSGFLMKHIDSGESIMATFIADVTDEATSEVALMVYASMPRPKMVMVPEHEYSESSDSDDDAEGENEEDTSPWKRVGPRLASFFKKRQSSSDVTQHMRVEPGEPERAVVIADLDKHAFTCAVNVIRRPLCVRQEEASSENEESECDSGESSNQHELVATFPCAPALFGPTVMSRLVATGGAFVEQRLLPPTTSDEFGCGPDGGDIPTISPMDDREPRIVDKNDSDLAGSSSVGDSDEDGAGEGEASTCVNKTIQLVQRGHCSFYSKAANQKRYANAEAVIVINNDDEELFIMSNGGGNDVDMREEELPVSVLVTGLDGEALLGLIQAESVAANEDQQVESYLLAQISIQMQEGLVNMESMKEKDEDIKWPIVRGSDEALQILAEGGWGIHAVRKDGGSVKDITGSNDLQIFLLKH
jgi:Glycosyl hydrolase family 47